jgi:hypothetical protein
MQDEKKVYLEERERKMFYIHCRRRSPKVIGDAPKGESLTTEQKGLSM